MLNVCGWLPGCCYGVDLVCYVGCCYVIVKGFLIVIYSMVFIAIYLKFIFSFIKKKLVVVLEKQLQAIICD